MSLTKRVLGTEMITKCKITSLFLYKILCILLQSMVGFQIFIFHLML